MSRKNWSFMIVSALCALNVEVGNYGVAVFIGLLALDMMEVKP